MKKLFTTSVLSMAVLICVVAPTNTWAIAYNVNTVIGAGGVTGTINTDGAVGVLSRRNVTDWNLLLNDGTSTFNLLGPLSGNNSELLVQGTSFTATVHDLLFNFSNVNGAGILFQNPNIGSGMNWYALEGANNGIGGARSSENLTVGTASDPDLVLPRSGVGSFATASGGSVPDPSNTLPLMGVALAGLTCFARRRV